DCNVCVEQDWRYAKILMANADGSDLKTFASGLRNSVFMAAHPLTGLIWATEMGRDWLGDNLPPDEINLILEGKDYGWPYCYGKRVHDDQFDPQGLKRDFCQTTMPSYIDIPAHSAPLGLAFFPASWPKPYRYDLLVAYHGSWNRTIPTGYKVVRYQLDEAGNFVGVDDFITGWLTPDGALGRPVDILITDDGEIYISDDKAGVIYRVVYKIP
ncbi:MAG TPA: PQQ-dependent sugar dehydrogenase, partial [Desulfobaccales bacterium]